MELQGSQTSRGSADCWNISLQTLLESINKCIHTWLLFMLCYPKPSGVMNLYDVQDINKSEVFKSKNLPDSTHTKH